MKVIVTGGRDYDERAFVYETLDTIHRNVGITLLIEGGARGADRLGRDWAKSRGVPFLTYEADWDNQGKAAGMIRNRLMLKENKEALVVAFPGGSGTIGCIKEAMKLGMKIT